MDNSEKGYLGASPWTAPVSAWTAWNEGPRCHHSLCRGTARPLRARGRGHRLGRAWGTGSLSSRCAGGPWTRSAHQARMQGWAAHRSSPPPAPVRVQTGLASRPGTLAPFRSCSTRGRFPCMVAAATVTVRHVVLEGGKDTFVFVFLVRRRITERKIQRGEGVLCSVFPGVSCTVQCSVCEKWPERRRWKNSDCWCRPRALPRIQGIQIYRKRALFIVTNIVNSHR